jgi:hypothetical protein
MIKKATPAKIQRGKTHFHFVRSEFAINQGHSIMSQFYLCSHNIKITVSKENRNSKYQNPVIQNSKVYIPLRTQN